ncbi:MAG: FAD/NAD(P)-binding oxidoreductase, partial [Tabrizicola sp.]|nr:FAD/NAD(P)-binding oxidoreductase [Tabrizicola sp.]
AGLTVATLLSRQLEGAAITVIEPREEHNYQPGYTLVGAGVKPADYTVLRTADFMPAGVTWLRETAAAFEPEANAVVTDAGTRLEYDYLVVATGLVLDYAAIEGMSTDLIGQHGIASVYAGPAAAAASWQALSAFADTGGVGIFTRPATDMKCAGAPLKQAFLADDHLRRRGTRDRSEVIYTAHSKLLFSVPLVTDRVEELFVRQGIEVRREHVLAAIDPATRIARFATPEGGSAEMKWDFINVIPPMRAPQSVRDSALPWQEGRMAADGWIEVDKFTLRHARFANVFGVGDICGVPKGKTAASVKWQAPVAVHHIVEEIASRAPVMTYNGYTSCPLITSIGTAMLVEFDYDDNLVPTFPGIDPLAEGWLPWVIKEVGLKAAYTAMLQGKA